MIKTGTLERFLTVFSPESVINPRLRCGKIIKTESMSSAVASRRTINTAEVSYNNTYPGTYGSLPSLGPSSATCTTASSSGACLIDNLLALGTKSGYTFTITGSGLSTSYTSKATPTANNTGTRQFCCDVNLVLCYSPTSSDCAVGTNPICFAFEKFGRRRSLLHGAAFFILRNSLLGDFPSVL